jgi:hypothetical protein
VLDPHVRILLLALAFVTSLAFAIGATLPLLLFLRWLVG